MSLTTTEMSRWTQYLFEQHPEEELRAWARRLGMFRFFRAYGGHANDGDSLELALAYHGQEELEAFLSTLGVSLVKYDVQPPQAQLWVSYRGDEIRKFPNLIDGTAWIQQPGHCEIAGIKVFIWCKSGRIHISMGSAYSVTAADVSDAEVVERALANAGLERVDPPLDKHHYICPKFYPDYFDDQRKTAPP